MSTRTQRSLKNFSTSMLLQVLTVGTGFVSTPLLLQWLGDERFGAFRSAYDWMGYLQLLEFGLSGALLPLLARALGNGDRQTVQFTLAVGIRAYFKAMVWMFGASLVLGVMLLYLVPIRPTLSSELQNGYWIGILTLLWLPLNPFRLLTDASQRSDIVNVAFLIQNLLITVSALFFAHRSFGIPGQFLAIVLGTLTATIFLSWRSLKDYPEILTTVFQPSLPSIKQQLYQLSLPTLVLNLSGRVALLTDNILIAYFLGPANVVPFMVSQRLFGLAQGQIQGIGNSTWAALAELYAKGELAQFNDRLVYLTRLVMIVGLTLMIPITIYNADFVRLWVGADRFAGWGVSLLAATNGIILGVLSLWGWCFSGTGNAPKVARITAIGAGVNVMISLIATPSFKLAGPLLGTLISFLTVQIWGSLHHLKIVFGVSKRALLRAVIYPLLLALLYAPGVAWCAQSYPPSGWIELGSSMMIAAFGFLALVWLILLVPEERSQWSQRLKRFVPISM